MRVINGRVFATQANSGLWTSDDQGASWTARATPGLLYGNPVRMATLGNKICLATSQNNSLSVISSVAGEGPWQGSDVGLPTGSRHSDLEASATTLFSAGGTTNAGGQQIPYVAQSSDAGLTWSPVSATGLVGPESTWHYASELCIHNGYLYASTYSLGGTFTSYAGTTRNRLARLLPNGDLDPDFMATESGFDGDVLEILVQPDHEILVGGNFSTVHGQSRSYLVRLLPNGDRDTTFLPSLTGPNGTVRALALAGESLYIGGDFGSFNGTTTGRIAKTDVTGLRDANFNPGGSGISSGTVFDLAVQTDGKLLVTGSFTSYDSVTRYLIARVFTGSPPLVAADPLETFLSDAGVPANLRGPNDDADSDGLDNLIEYALDLNPNGNCSGAFTGTPPALSTTPTLLQLTYRRVHNDVTYIVETSPTLTGGTWTSVGVNQGTPAGDGTTTASIPVVAGSGFLRLSVTKNS